MESSSDSGAMKTSIHTLPPNTIEQISSSQVLTDPSSVVKELIDNAIDARATSIFIEISFNSLDVIQVRDNGHGIAPEDRALVCRRYCTSKIRDFEDLKEVGGKSLGFRGEALASVAEMSDGLAIITRIEGEPVAVLLKVGRNGDIKGQEHASHPVGTTVRVTDFFKSLPVRKQAALKHSPKYLGKVKRLIQTYAFSRPTTRFSLRILKAKNDKGNWVYAPKPGATVADAAFNVVGRDCASQCVWSVLKSNGFDVQAFLPRPDANSSKIANLGRFIYIDSRPVSTARGPLKQMMTMFMQKLRKANSGLESAKDPFIYMNIGCPPNSYDPNIEPAKDDVLFGNSGLILGVVEELLGISYPAVSANSLPKEHEIPVSGTSPNGMEVRIIVGHKSPVTIFEEDSDNTSSVPKNRRTWRPNMYGIDEEELELLDENQLTLDSQESEDTPQAPQNTAISNPWTIAKMNALVKATSTVTNTQPLTLLKDRRVAEMNSSSSLPSQIRQRQLTLAPLTPQSSSPAKSIRSLTDKELDRSIGHIPRLLGCGRIDRSSAQGIFYVGDTAFSEGRQSTNEPNIGFVSAGKIPHGTPLDAIPEALPRPRRNPRKQRGNSNKPYVSPITNPQKSWFGSLSSPEKSSQSPRRQHQASPNNTAVPFFRNSIVRTERDVVLDGANALSGRVPGDRNRDIRDSVAMRRPQWDIQQHSAPASRNTSVLPNHTVTYNHASNEGQGNATSNRDEMWQSAKVQPEERLARTTDSLNHNSISQNLSLVEDHEIHESSSRRQRRTTDHLHRAKSSQLSLERVPSKSHLQNISILVFTSAANITQSLRKLDTNINYVDWRLLSDRAYDAFSTTPTPDVVRSWISRLHMLLNKIYPEKNITGDLGANIQEYFTIREQVGGSESFATI